MRELTPSSPHNKRHMSPTLQNHISPLSHLERKKRPRPPSPGMPASLIQSLTPPSLSAFALSPFSHLCWAFIRANLYLMLPRLGS